MRDWLKFLLLYDKDTRAYRQVYHLGFRMGDWIGKKLLP